MSVLSARPRRLGERYEVQELLGRGGMADVYRAQDEVLDRPVAVKVLRDVASQERFRTEARMLARLAHPGLVTVLDAGISDGLPWLVMELVEGPMLAEVCHGVGLEPTRVADVGHRLADALAHVHRNGLVHRDVKPGNILLADDGRVLLTDFGIARLVEGHEPLTETGFTMGTAAYLAPEQVRGEPLTSAVDVYSLGLVLLEALTGRRAYPGATAEAALARLSRPPEVPEDLADGWHRLLTAMTALDPAARPAPDRVARELGPLAAGAQAGAATVGLRAAPAPTRSLTTPVPRVTTRVPRDGTSPSRVAGPRPRVTAVGSPGVRDVLPALAALAGRVREVGHPLGRWGSAARERAGLPVLRGRVVWLGAAVVLLVVLVAAVLTGGDRPRPTGPPLPSGVPSQVSADLQRLHEAVNGS